MLNFAELAHQPRVFQSLTSLSLTAFAQLLPTFERAYETAQDAADAQRQTARQRARAVGAPLFWPPWPINWFSPCSTSACIRRKRPKASSLASAKGKPASGFTG